MGTMTSQSSRLVVTLSTSTTKGSTQGRAGECKMPAEAVTSVAALLNVVLRVTAAVQKCVRWHSCCQRKDRVRREISPTARWFWQLSYLISMHHITREEELGCKHLNQSSTTNHDETTRPQCCTAAALPPCLGDTLSHSVFGVTAGVPRYAFLAMCPRQVLLHALKKGDICSGASPGQKDMWVSAPVREVGGKGGSLMGNFMRKQTHRQSELHLKKLFLPFRY